MFPPSTGPIEVTLTRPVDDIPRQCRTLEGQLQLAYELKIDGWRLILSKTPAGAVELWSRHGRNLTTAFPELAAAALEHLAPGNSCGRGGLCTPPRPVRLGSAATPTRVPRSGAGRGQKGAGVICRF